MGNEEPVAGNPEDDALTEAEKGIIARKLASTADGKDIASASGLVSDSAPAHAGVLKSLVTFPEDPMQILSGANFADTNEARLAVAALDEAERYGTSQGRVFKLIASLCGVPSTHKSNTEWGIQGLTHIELSRNEPNKFSLKTPKISEKKPI